MTRAYLFTIAGFGATLDLLTAILLGAIQGLTEFIPVSSSGHLVLAEHLFGEAITMDTAGAQALNVLVHLGSLAAILLVFRRDVLKLFWPHLSWPNIGLLLLASVPAGVIGVALVKGWVIPKEVGDVLLHSPWAAAFGLLVTTLFLFASERRPAGKPPHVAGQPPAASVESRMNPARTWWTACIVGLAQAVAILPGVSRSGSTVSTALILGWQRPDALRLSFLMGAIAIGGAGLLEARHIGELPPVPAAGAFVSSFVCSICGLWVIKLLVMKRLLRWFGIYTLLLAVAALIWLALEGRVA